MRVKYYLGKPGESGGERARVFLGQVLGSTWLFSGPGGDHCFSWGDMSEFP